MTASRTPTIKVWRSLLRAELRFFIRKAFSTISPGDTYLHNWHVDAIAHELMRVHSGKSRRLLINLQPRSLKSICVSVAYVAWLLGHDPTRRIIVASYSGDFAAELHRQFRMVISSQWFAELFPELRFAKETGLELVTTQGGSRFATSVGGTLTGRGADLIIVDDPLNANELHSETARKRVIEWYGGALVQRLNDKETGPIIVLMQRLHEDDLAGHLLQQGGWNHLNLPTIALEDETFEVGGGRTHFRRSGDILHPERESREALEAIKAEVGSLLFSAQYQQQPVPAEGNLIRRAWFKAYDDLPVVNTEMQIIQSWDVAMMTSDRNDYSACTTWLIHKNDAYLVHVYRGRLEYPDLRRKVIGIAAEHGATTVLIEDAGPGMNLLQDLGANMPRGMTRPIGMKPEGSKVDRMAAQSAKIEAGHVHLPKSAPWLGDFLTELLSFPNGRHDDQVDSVSQFLRWLQNAYLNEIPIVMPFVFSVPRQFP
jgi:predicted phage terminase large subunit-like protein